jgi:hypothetical protein
MKEPANLSKSRPKGWEESQIGPYCETLWNNTIATFANKDEVKRLIEIDDLFVEFACADYDATNKLAAMVPLLLFFRSHSAFRVSAAIGMGGAVAEAMATMRICLEAAGYASLAAENEELAKRWLDRDESAESRKAMRKIFGSDKIRGSVKRRDLAAGAAYDEIYDRLIQFGAHPNEKAAMGALLIDEVDGQADLSQIYLHDDSDSVTLDHCLRTNSQVGVTALRVFSRVFGTQFDRLAIVPKLLKVCQGL